jgi:uncharacterized membrane protein
MRRALLALALGLAPAAGNAAALIEIPEQNGLKMVEIWDVSGDGRVLVGGCSLASGGGSACRWREGQGLEALETPSGADALALGTSHDGSVVVGIRWAALTPFRAVRWDADGALEDLPLPQGAEDSFAEAVSADGAVIVGGILLEDGQFAFRWTSAAGMELSPQPAYAYAVSADGSTVAGCCSPGGSFLWTQGGDFSFLPGLNAAADPALGISADGEVVAGGGSWETDVPWRWTAAEGATPLGAPAGLLGPALAHDVSGDGSVVVGSELRFWGESFVWDAGHGKRSLADALREVGVSSRFAALEETRAVSDDGRRIGATGIRGDGSRVAVLAVLGLACDDGVDNDRDGLVDMADAQCVSPSHPTELSVGCGLGFELALVLPLLAARARRRAERSTRTRP